MSLQEAIKSKLEAAFSPLRLDVINESEMHNVPRGSETHFRVLIVSASFEEKSRIARHQLVYGALATELRNGLHALAITSKTPEEWNTSPAAALSPPCLGGSKADERDP